MFKRRVGALSFTPSVFVSPPSSFMVEKYCVPYVVVAHYLYILRGAVCQRVRDVRRKVGAVGRRDHRVTCLLVSTLVAVYAVCVLLPRVMPLALPYPVSPLVKRRLRSLFLLPPLVLLLLVDWLLPAYVVASPPELPLPQVRRGRVNRHEGLRKEVKLVAWEVLLVAG